MPRSSTAVAPSRPSPEGSLSTHLYRPSNRWLIMTLPSTVRFRLGSMVSGSDAKQTLMVLAPEAAGVSAAGVSVPGAGVSAGSLPPPQPASRPRDSAAVRPRARILRLFICMYLQSDSCYPLICIQTPVGADTGGKRRPAWAGRRTGARPCPCRKYKCTLCEVHYSIHSTNCKVLKVRRAPGVPLTGAAFAQILNGTALPQGRPHVAARPVGQGPLTPPSALRGGPNPAAL